VDGLDDCFSDTRNNPFIGIDTQYRQTQFYKTHLNLIVSLYFCALLNYLTNRNLSLYHLVNDMCGKVVEEKEDAS